MPLNKMPFEKNASRQKLDTTLNNNTKNSVVTLSFIEVSQIIPLW